MAVQSAAVHSMRQGGTVDPNRQAEYPIVLGDSLKRPGNDQARFVGVRYNWKPKHIHAKQKTIITQDSGAADANSYQLLIQSEPPDAKPYKYHGKLAPEVSLSSSSGQPSGSSFALVYDPSKPAFRLEPITTLLNFNLVSGPGQNSSTIHKHPLILLDPKHDQVHEAGIASVEEENLTAEDSDGDDDLDQEPDKNNPYDFRHFLSEAKAAAEAGHATPRPGSMSGMASPVPGVSRLLTPSRPGTPLNVPKATTTSAEAAKKRKVSDELGKPAHAISAVRNNAALSSTAQKKRAAPLNRKGVKTVLSSSTKPKTARSVERISDSDSADAEEGNVSDTITLPPPPLSARSSKPKHSTSERRAFASSPHIVVDEASDLVIDLGSPPHTAASRQKKKFTINPDAFAGGKSNAGSNVASPARGGTDIDAEGDTDIDMLEDGDVEDLVLPSPRAARGSSSVSISRLETGLANSSRTAAQAPAPESMDEDEDDELAAQLEAALAEGEGDDEGVPIAEGEEDDDARRGLGILTGGGHGAGGSVVMVGGNDDDESEVSEEE